LVRSGERGDLFYLLERGEVLIFEGEGEIPLSIISKCGKMLSIC
jgi:hypothetical protein